MQPVKKVQLAASDVKLLAMKGYTVGMSPQLEVRRTYK